MASPLEPNEWDKLLVEKKYELTVAKTAPILPGPSTAGAVLHNAPFFSKLCNLALGSSRSLRNIGTVISRGVAEIQVDRKLRSLVQEDKQYRNADEKTVARVRSDWLELQR